MRSDLHKELQNKAEGYLLNKGYWICGQEVPMPIGICDAWGMSRVNELDTMAIEVKVSRTDFRSRSQRYKEVSSFPLGNYQYVLCPAGLIQPQETHHEWGLLWWTGDRMLNKKKAVRMDMTAENKLQILLYFLDNTTNHARPLLKEQQMLNLKPLQTYEPVDEGIKEISN